MPDMKQVFTFLQDSLGKSAIVKGIRKWVTDSKFRDFAVPMVGMDAVTSLVTTELLAGGAPYTQPAVSRLEDVLAASARYLVYTDQPGTLYVEDSANGSAWTVRATVAVTGGTLADSGWVALNSQALYYRARYVNGANVQTVFQLREAISAAAAAVRVAEALPAGTNKIGEVDANLKGRSVVGAAETLTVNATVGGVPLAVIPADATGAMMTLEGGDIRALWTGGAPTAAVGHLVVYGDTIQLMNRADLLAFRAIRTGTTDGSLTITYYK